VRAASVRRASAQFARFGTVGVVVNIALFGVYLTITSLGLDPVPASALCFLLGVPVSFLAHSRITFVFGAGASLGRKAIFAGAYLAAFLLQTGGLYALHDLGGFPHRPAQLFMMCVVAAFLFLVQKLVVFRV
jgi:putative flippase GtrA